MKLFVNMDTQEWGYFYEKPKDWIEAPKETQAVYCVGTYPIFYKIHKAVLMIFKRSIGEWVVSPLTVKELISGGFATHLWGTLQDFDL